MEINRLDFIRRLRIAGSVGRKAVRFAPDGKFTAIGPSTGFMVFGKGWPFHKDVAFVDVGLVMKHLKCFTAVNINVEILGDEEIMFASREGGPVWGGNIHRCELMPPCLVEEYRQDILDELSALPYESAEVQIDSLVMLGNNIRRLKPIEVCFASPEGVLTAVFKVRRDVCYFPLASLSLQGYLSFNPQKLLDIIDVLDDTPVKLSFADYGKTAILCIEIRDFVWFLSTVSNGTKARKPRQLQKM